mgnify:CR=1 FL=1
MNPTMMYKCIDEDCGWCEYIHKLSVAEHQRIIRRSKCPECGDLVLAIDRVDFTEFELSEEDPENV